MKLYKFYMLSCAPCKMFAPVVAEVAEYLGLDVVEINVDKQPDVAQKFGVMSVPTIVLVDGEKPIWSAAGYLPKAELLRQLREAIQNKIDI